LAAPLRLPDAMHQVEGVGDRLDQARRRLGVTRRALLEELDRLHLKELPGEAYCFAEWRLRRVGLDYHVDVEAHFYSVPYRFARRERPAAWASASRVRKSRRNRRDSTRTGNRKPGRQCTQCVPLRARWVWCKLNAAPKTMRIVVIAATILAVFSAMNLVYQVLRKPTEVFAPVKWRVQ
jgi:hypothetical protein